MLPEEKPENGSSDTPRPNLPSQGNNPSGDTPIIISPSQSTPEPVVQPVTVESPTNTPEAPSTSTFNGVDTTSQPVANVNDIRPPQPTVSTEPATPQISESPINIAPPSTPSSSDQVMPLMHSKPPEVPSQPQQEPAKPKKKSKLKVLLIVLAVFVLFGSTSGAYIVGKNSVTKTDEPEVTAKPITLPPEAIVTAECVPGRGKQYIIPKDIPVGPIYDVNNGNVIAIEYNISIVDLLSNPDTFSDTLNELMKNYSTDHFTLVPSPPKPGQQVSEVHLIMFVVPKEEAASITCGLTPEQLSQLQSGGQTTPTEAN